MEFTQKYFTLVDAAADNYGFEEYGEELFNILKKISQAAADKPITAQDINDIIKTESKLDDEEIDNNIAFEKKRYN